MTAMPNYPQTISSHELNLACVVGARPNFMKMAPLLRAFEKYPHVRTTLIHTGQHYDKNLSGIFFQELGIKEPDVNLEVGSSKHGANGTSTRADRDGAWARAGWRREVRPCRRGR